MLIYVVEAGDSVYSISQRYNISPASVISDNALTNPNSLVKGQALVLMIDSIPHEVRRGQSLYSLARGYGVSLESIISANGQIEDPSRIEVGEVINIPIGGEKLGTIYVNGYAYPSITEATLEKTMPYLTYLSLFSYQFHPDGSLVPINDSALIALARGGGVAPMMVITNIDEGGGFSGELAHAVLTDEAAGSALIANIISTLKEKNYFGLDIDFEYLFPEDREAYNNFLRRVTEELHPLGYTVTTALAPKISATQAGTLYEAHDYPVHGRLADHVIIMTYEWGFTFGPPMPVAPINEVRRVLNYAVSAIPREKILMGMPNYGYDWTLPYRPGTAARSLSNTAAINLAAEVGAAIQYDSRAQAPFFNYYDSAGREHIVWFDDARSIRARLSLVNEYGLGGVSYWTINSFFPQNWLVLNSMYDVRKLL